MKRKDAYALLDWYAENKRDLPWRHTKDAYRIWVSEIMLQQTRVEAVKPYYHNFLEKYPDAAALAKADDEELTRIWEGLGYYSRVRNMHKAAMEVVNYHGGFFPVSYEVLLTLPGIGAYTAGAVASIAGGEAVPAVDGNVLRVYSRLTAEEGEITDAKVSGRIRSELEDLMKQLFVGDASSKSTKEEDPTGYTPGDFNSAMMELGATVCLPNGEPKCELCPIKKACTAKKQGNMTDYPKKAKKTARRIEERTVFILQSTEGIGLRKRPNKGLLAGMYELPAAEGHLSEKEAGKYIKELGYHPLRIKKAEDAKHIFSHIEWHMKAYYVLVDDISDPAKKDEENGIFFVSKKEREAGFALPSAFSAYKKYFS